MSDLEDHPGSSLLQSFGQGVDKGPNLIADPAIAVALLLFTGSSRCEFFCQGRRVAETDVQHFFRPRKKRTGLAGVIADGYDRIESDMPKTV